MMPSPIDQIKGLAAAAAAQQDSYSPDQLVDLRIAADHRDWQIDQIKAQGAERA